MIKPIRVAPFSQTRMISENPLIPNTMTNEQYLANQFASGVPPVGVPRQTTQPVSPVAGLSQLGQQGLEGARNQQRTASKVSQKVGGLLGGGETASGLLGDVQGEAALQGLFATMQAIGRPVRRGEDRFAGATQYGQQVMGQAQQRGLQDLSTRMQLEKYQREKQLQDVKLAAMQEVGTALKGTTSTDQLTSFSDYALSQMDDAQKGNAKQAEVYSSLADKLAVTAPELAKEFRASASTFRDQALRGIRTQEKANELELAQNEKFAKRYADPTNEIIRRRNSLVSLLQGGGSVGNYVAFVAALKSVEPDSAVLSSEFESATSLGALTTKIMSSLAKLDQAEMLPDVIRKDLERVAELMTEASMDFYNLGVESVKQKAADMKLNADNIIEPVMGLRGESTYMQSQKPKGSLSERSKAIRGGG
jgi:hypothetical protein